MKKTVCIVLSALIIASGCCVTSFAEKEKDNPTILISGFLCSQLYFDYGTEDETNIWTAMVKKATEYAGDELSSVAGSFGKLITGKDDEFGESLGEAAEIILGLFSCNPDGTSVHTTEMLALNIYNNFYARSGAAWKGIGQAKAVVFCIMVIAISMIQLKATRSKEVQQ